nr:unnamed protein product [Callosobruchus analis]
MYTCMGLIRFPNLLSAVVYCIMFVC